MDKLLNIDELRRWHDVFKPNGELFEVRILGDKTYSGYFFDIEHAIPMMQNFDMGRNQFYFTVNAINPACSSRAQFENFQIVKGSSTSDNDIVNRDWLPIDIDVERPANVSSSNEEKEYAHQKALKVYKTLREHGFPNAVVCDSSSGYHIYFPISLPNNGDTKKIIEDFYVALSNCFTDDKVKIDKVVGNASRIMRMAGSWGRKGRDSEDRPHRMARILKIPQDKVLLTAEKIQEFTRLFKVEDENKGNYRQNSQYRGNPDEDFDIREFIRKYGIKVAREVDFDNGGTKFVLEECPFNPDHKAPDSAIFLFRSGAVSFRCLHNSCANHGWRELRTMFEPHAYDHESQQPYQQQRTYQQAPAKPKYQIKEENAELGKKWFSMSDIKKLDLSQIKSMKTGFVELDKAIVGLSEGEVSILSGSNSSGKSSWINSLLMNVINQGNKCALWSGELRPDILKTWIQLVAAGKRNLRPSKLVGKYYVPTPVAERIDQWLDGKLFIYNNEYSSKWEQVFNDMNELLGLGVNLFVLDNLFSLDIDVLSGDKNNKQKELILQICAFAKKNHVHIILVAHPRKVCTFLRKNDISGSSDLTNAVDNVFIAHRVNKDFMKGGTEFLGANTISQFSGFGNVIEVAKNRMYGVVDRMFGMYYEIESRRFLNEQNEDIAYAWEGTATQTDIVESEQAPVKTVSDEEYEKGVDSEGNIVPF